MSTADVTRSNAVERIAAVICANPVTVADSMGIWRRYLSEDEREEWRADAREIVDAMIELGWTPPVGLAPLERNASSQPPKAALIPQGQFDQAEPLEGQ